MVQSEPTDGTRARILTLKTVDGEGNEQEDTTNEGKARCLYEQFFRKKPRREDMNLPERPKYKKAFDFEPISELQLRGQIDRLAPHKAPGPDGIPNIFFKECKEVIVPFLLTIYRATFKLNWYPEEWKKSKTVVIRKPNLNKDNYHYPKAYRPIALLNTMAKILSACVAEILSTEGERHSLLPATQFGGRQGKTTTDAILLLLYHVKTALRKKKSVVIRFSDIEAAFPSTAIERLLHDMRTQGIPKQITTWLGTKFQGRSTTLNFEDYESNPFDITHGLDQGCPLSPILFNYYTASLIQTAKGKDEIVTSFVDDIFSLTIADTIEQAQNRQKDLETRKGGFKEWKETHACQVELSKDNLLQFSPKGRGDTEKPLVIGEYRITPTEEVKYLGIIIDKTLSWKKHTLYALGKGTRTVAALKRLAKQTGGIPPYQMRRLYLTIVVPRMMYAAECFVKPFTNIGKRNAPGQEKEKGSAATAKKFQQVQRNMAIDIIGAMRTTAGDVAEIHANLIPVKALLNKICQRATTRIATLPISHPLKIPFNRTKKRMIKRHPTQLHFLANRLETNFESVETIPTINNKKDEDLQNIDIRKNREEAIIHQRNNKTGTRIYTDGSSIEGQVGAAAVLYRNGKKRILQHKLGSDRKHTVYEAELVGMLLGNYLLRKEKHIQKVTISESVDNQAALTALKSTKPRSGHVIQEQIMKESARILNKNKQMTLTYTWCPGHEGIKGNEEADELAKAAARGHTNHPADLPTILRKTLPINAAAARLDYRNALRSQIDNEWRTSERFNKYQNIDRRLNWKTEGLYLKNTSKLPRRQISILTQLRTGHAPLNDFLFKIGKADSKICEKCKVSPETTKHYLIDCPGWKEQRKQLQQIDARFRKEMKHLLGNENFFKITLRYVNATRRFSKTHGNEGENIEDGKDE